MKKIHITLIVIIIAVVAAVFLLSPKNTGNTVKDSKPVSTGQTPAGQSEKAPPEQGKDIPQEKNEGIPPKPAEGAPPQGSGDFQPPVDLSKLVPPGEFEPLKPLDPADYKDLTPEVKDIFDKPGKDLLAERRLSGTNPYTMMKEMGLKEGDNIADIGCGTGYYTFIFAWKVGKKTKSGDMTIVEPLPGDKGMMYAVDINKAMLTYDQYMLEHLKTERKIEFRNIKFLASDEKAGMSGIPAGSLDFAFLSETHAYNHIWGNTSHLVNSDMKKSKEAYFKSIGEQTAGLTKTVYEALKPGGIYIITENDIKDRPTESILYKEDVVKLLESTGKFKMNRIGDFYRNAYILFMKKI
ncbi:MAG: methyltransferase domain-containing protein [Firmicutes bacterium]|nr:methyltransferase domain-containing protein [Bacillota bacterium]